VEDSVDRALAWLASRQQADGSFPSVAQAQPAATSLAVMALLSRGHQPGLGPYGEKVNRAIDFVVGCQREDGLFSYEVPEAQWMQRRASHTATYNHGIAGLMLGEVYGQVSGERAKRVRFAIARALVFTRRLQLRNNPPQDRGGWRYLRESGSPYADLSASIWQIMFLRSARNSEFNVPQDYVTDAMAFVHRCWDPSSGGFAYAADGSESPARGMSGAGIVALAMAGEHQTLMARSAGDWLLAHPLRGWGQTSGNFEKFIYSAFYCSQAAAQLGGRYWEKLYPPIARILLDEQMPGGAWPPDPNLIMFGPELTTAFAVLTLTPPYQILPVYQR
jgi:hypothetical protein